MDKSFITNLNLGNMSLLEELNTKELRFQSLVLPNRPVQTPEEWQFEI